MLTNIHLFDSISTKALKKVTDELLHGIIFKNKNPLQTFCLYDENDDCLFTFGDSDIHVNKEEYKFDSFCKASKTNNFDYQNYSLTNILQRFKFIPERIVAFKMKE